MPDFAACLRIGMILRSLCDQGATYEEKKYIWNTCERISLVSTSFLASASHELAYCLVYYAYQTALERLWTRIAEEFEDEPRFEIVRGLRLVGRIWISEDMGELLDPD
jgi:mannose/cellobiose epimerase-like protein (N-acyl-D-glucosamine 2-epimerase family)